MHRLTMWVACKEIDEKICCRTFFVIRNSRAHSHCEHLSREIREPNFNAYALFLLELFSKVTWKLTSRNKQASQHTQRHSTKQTQASKSQRANSQEASGMGEALKYITPIIPTDPRVQTVPVPISPIIPIILIIPLAPIIAVASMLQ